MLGHCKNVPASEKDQVVTYYHPGNAQGLQLRRVGNASRCFSSALFSILC
jgi:hypothetical protein